MSDHQNWQEQLQQKVGDLLARRLGNFAEDLQQVQTVLNDLCQRLPSMGTSVTAEEAAGFQQQIEQYAENNWQTHAANYEAQIQNLQAQLATAQQNAGLAAGAAGIAVTGTAAAPRYDAFKAAIADIDAQRQQADVLASLVRHAAQFAPRVVFFVIKSGSAIGWKATGFANGLSDDTVRALNIPVVSNTLLNEAVNSLRTASTNNSSGVLGHYAQDTTQSVAVPLVIRGKAAAILYAEATGQDNGLHLDALESLMQITSMAIELLPVRRTQPAAAAPAPAPAPVAPPAVTPEPTAFVAPPPVVKPVVEEQSFAPTPVVAPFPTLTPVEVPAEKVEVAAQAEAVAVPAPPPAPVAAPSSPQSDDEVRAHNDARRFARLLVSEIKLYNEQKVVEGRRSNDLYERLKEDIDRSRQMYEKRVSPPVAAKYDYFYDELLHTLAEGDAGKLGRGCPGPTVPVS